MSRLIGVWRAPGDEGASLMARWDLLVDCDCPENRQSMLRCRQNSLTSISAASVPVSSTVGIEIALFTIDSAFEVISVCYMESMRN